MARLQKALKDRTDKFASFKASAEKQIGLAAGALQEQENQGQMKVRLLELKVEGAKREASAAAEREASVSAKNNELLAFVDELMGSAGEGAS